MSFALNIVVKTSIVLITAAMASILLRRSSAATRHAIWAGAIISALLLPFAALLLPQLQLPVLPETNTSVRVIPVNIQSTAATLRPVKPLATHSGRQVLAGLWLAGVTIFLLRLIAGALRLRRLSKSARGPADATWKEVATELSDSLGCHKPVQLLLSPEEVSPMTWGMSRHTIVLPASAQGWSVERRRLVLAHELAHVKRNDALLHFFVQLACGVYWFNPMVWYAAARARIERERACDDRVLHLGTPAAEYAEHLVQIVRGLQRQRLFSFAGMSMAQPSQLESRVVSLLDSRARRQTVSKAGLCVLCALSALVTFSIAGINLTGAVPLPPALVVSTRLSVPPEPKTASVPPQQTRIGNKGAVTSSLVVPPQVIETPAPLYGTVEGTVTLEASVDVEGNVRVLRVVNGLNSELDAKAIQAVTSWQFAPALKEGVPVAAITQIDVEFQSLPERISGGVKPPTIIKRVEPQYSQEARDVRYQGTVVLQGVVRKDGSVDIVHVVRSIGLGLDENAAEALKQWVFRPAMKNGEPVDVTVNIEVNFKLRDDAPVYTAPPSNGGVFQLKIDSPQ